MAEIAGLGGLSAVLHIVEGLSGTVTSLRDLKDAPSQVEDFQTQSESFCNNLLMFYEISDQHIPLLKEQAGARMRHAIGLIKQSERVAKGLKELLIRLEGLYKGAIGPVESLKLLWGRVLWVLKQDQTERLKTNMNLATVLMNCFVNMLLVESKETTVVEDVVAREKNEIQIRALRGQLERQVPAIRAHRRRLRKLDASEPSQTQEEKRETESIMKRVKEFEHSLKGELDNSSRRSEPARNMLVNPLVGRESFPRTTNIRQEQEKISSRGSMRNRSSELSRRPRQREDPHSIKAEPEPIEQLVTPKELRIQSSSVSDLSQMQQSGDLVPQHLTVSRIPTSIQAPRIRDKGFGPEESYGQWPDSIVQSRENDEEPEDELKYPSTQNSTIQAWPVRRRGKSLADSVKEQMVGNSSSTLNRANTEDVDSRESGSKNQGSRQESSTASISQKPNFLEHSKKIRHRTTNNGLSDNSCASASRMRKRPISPSRLDDGLHSAESSEKHKNSPPRNRRLSQSTRAVHENRSIGRSTSKAAAEARAKLRDTSRGDKRRKGFRQTAEKKARDTNGMVLSSPTEDDQFGRRKRRNRGE